MGGRRWLIGKAYDTPYKDGGLSRWAPTRAARRGCCETVASEGDEHTMSTENSALLVVITVPPTIRVALTEDDLSRLRAAHPNVGVELIEAPTAFLERLSDADAAVVWPTFLPSNAVLVGHAAFSGAMR